MDTAIGSVNVRRSQQATWTVLRAAAGLPAPSPLEVLQGSNHGLSVSFSLCFLGWVGGRLYMRHAMHP
jgi:hypothetical protein